MSAVLHFVNQHLSEPVGEKLPEKSNNITQFEQGPEHRLRRALDEIAELQSEVRTLREELFRAEREVEKREILIRNAMVREQELRAELVQSLF